MFCFVVVSCLYNMFLYLIVFISFYCISLFVLFLFYYICYIVYVTLSMVVGTVIIGVIKVLNTPHVGFL